MIHFRSKENVINWLIDNCPRPAIKRALVDGRIEFLGGFDPIPPSILPGWIVKATSIYGKKNWYVAILANDIKHYYEIRIIKSVPWKNWVGTTFWDDNDFRVPLFSGDNPKVYRRLKDGKN